MRNSRNLEYKSVIVLAAFLSLSFIGTPTRAMGHVEIYQSNNTGSETVNLGGDVVVIGEIDPQNSRGLTISKRIDTIAISGETYVATITKTVYRSKDALIFAKARQVSPMKEVKSLRSIEGGTRTQLEIYTVDGIEIDEINEGSLSNLTITQGGEYIYATWEDVFGGSSELKIYSRSSSGRQFDTTFIVPRVYDFVVSDDSPQFVFAAGVIDTSGGFGKGTFLLLIDASDTIKWKRFFEKDRLSLIGIQLCSSSLLANTKTIFFSIDVFNKINWQRNINGFLGIRDISNDGARILYATAAGQIILIDAVNNSDIWKRSGIVEHQGEHYELIRPKFTSDGNVRAKLAKRVSPTKWKSSPYDAVLDSDGNLIQIVER